RRLVAVEREAGPGVQIEQHDLPLRRHDHVASIDLETERACGAAYQSGKPSRVERVSRDALSLVVEPPEPRRLAVGSATRADAVELDEVALYVWLKDRARDPAGGKAAERGGDRLAAIRRHDVPVLRVVHVRSLDPHGAGHVGDRVLRGEHA